MDLATLIWVVVSAIATLIALVGVREGTHDVRAIAGVSNGRRIVAFMHFRNQLGRLVIGAGWTVLGYAALVGTPFPRDVAVAVLVASNLVLTVNAALDLRARRQILVDTEKRLTAEERHAQLMAQGKETSEKADAAYHEANTLNVKINHLNERLMEQGQRADKEIRRTDKHQGVQDGRIDGVEKRDA